MQHSTIKIGDTFHDGYDVINAKWKVIKKLPNNKFLCQITDKNFNRVTHVYDYDMIEMLIAYEDASSLVGKCEVCGEKVYGGYKYCFDCEIEVLTI